MPLALLMVVAALPLWAAEYAVLTNGFRLRAERHTTEGAQTTLWDRDGGYTVLATELIAEFEPDDPAAPMAPIAPKPPNPAPDPVQAAADRHGVSPLLIDSVIRAESAYNPSAVSPKGAVGLMQLMPATARELGVSDARDPAQNVNGGVSYLRQLLERYKAYPNRLERALAAYNAGPARADRYGGLPPYRETVDFVARVAQAMLRAGVSVPQR